MKFSPIGFVKSPYKQKFAIPRQANLVKQACGEIILTGEFSDPDAFRGLEQFSHLWLLFIFHENADKGWSPLVRPPRLGGKERMGVFASRASFRPNPVGMSAVEFVALEENSDSVILKVRGLDLLDGTPIIDIKPYLPYADNIPAATGGYAEEVPSSNLTIEFSTPAEVQLVKLKELYPDLRGFINSVLLQDPRPAYRKGKLQERVYGMNLYDLNIRWQVQNEHVEVLSIEFEKTESKLQT